MYTRHENISINSNITIGLGNLVCLRHDGVNYIVLHDAHRASLHRLEECSKEVAKEIVPPNSNDFIAKVNVIVLHKNILLVMACLHNMHAYSIHENDCKLIFSASLKTILKADSTIVAIEAISSKTFVVASRHNLVFWEVGNTGHEVTIQSRAVTLVEQVDGSAYINHVHPIGRLQFVVADSINTIGTWKYDEKVFEGSKSHSITTHPNTRINYFGVYKKLYILGTMCGQIQLVDSASGTMLLEIQAHVKAITSFDISAKTGMLVTSSEDSFVQVFKLNVNNANQIKVEHLYQTSLKNEIISKVHFVSSDAKSFVVLTYESNHAKLFKWKG